MLLQNLLSQYIPLDETEAQMTAHLSGFLNDRGISAFHRDLADDGSELGHVTGSAWVVNSDGSKAVLLHHAKLGIWVQPGGHCDGEADVAQVALREAREETGLEVSLVDTDVFDVDVHRIPEYWNTPEHFHFDVRFLLQADESVAPILNEESREVRWVSLDEAAALNSTPSIGRMIAKTRMRFRQVD